MRTAPLAIFALVAAAVACGGDDGVTVDAAPSQQHIAGTISYEDRPQMIFNGRTILGNPTPKPARRIEVSVFSEGTGEALGQVTTDETGAYSIDYLGASDDTFHIAAIAESKDPLHPMKVIKTSADNGPTHAFGGAAFEAGTATVDLLITDASKEAEAFNVFDTLQLGFDKLNSAFSQMAPIPLTVRWFPGNDPGTTHYVDAIHLIDLEGFTSDDDGFDDDVMLHEFGHYVAATQSRDDSPGGSHNGGAADARLAWSEGWATYWEMFVSNEPLYIDTSASGGFFDNSDAEVDKANPAGALNQDVTEGMVTEILWDLGDSDAGVGIADDDAYAGDHLTNVLVLKDYLKTATLRNVGKQGVDLVDFLDGWFIANGLTDCAAVKTIVTTTHAFPYDYAGPGGTCP